MANIKTHLNNIKGALYGKDVRNSIHDAIEQCYTDASINGNANMEVTQARGEYETLGERLDDHASQLAHKANQMDLETQARRIDNFTKLSEGSTTGDAELIDARISADGQKYSNVGNSIRAIKNLIDPNRDILIDNYYSKKSYNQIQISVSNGAVKNNETSFHIPSGSLGQNSYISCYLRLNDLFKKSGESVNLLTVWKVDSKIETHKLAIRLRGNAETLTINKSNIVRDNNYVYAYYNIVIPENTWVISDLVLTQGISLDTQIDIEYVDSYINTEDYYNYRGKIDALSLNLEETVIDTVFLTLPKEIIVDVNGEGDYLTLKEGIAEAIKSPNSKVIVMPGEYDLVNEWGETFLNSFNNSKESSKGIVLTNGVHVFFKEGAKVKFNYAGTNDMIKKYFSPFVNFLDSVGDFTLENLDLESANCRYGIHDDPESATKPYTHKYINCKIKHSGDTYRPAIGAGLGKNGLFIIEGGCYESNSFSGNGTISIHNSIADNAQSKIIINNVYCVKKSDGEGGNIRISYYGDSNKITTAYISNCSFETEPIIAQENSTYSNINVEIVGWNNEIRAN